MGVEAKCASRTIGGYRTSIGPMTNNGRPMGIVFVEVSHGDRVAYEKLDELDATLAGLRASRNRLIADVRRRGVLSA